MKTITTAPDVLRRFTTGGVAGGRRRVSDPDVHRPDSARGRLRDGPLTNSARHGAA